MVGLYQPELAGIRQNDVLGRGFNHSLFVLHDVGVDAGDAQTLVDPRHREKGLVGPVAADELHSLGGSKVVILRVVVPPGENHMDIGVLQQLGQNDEIITEHRKLKLGGQIKGHAGDRGAVIQKHPVPGADQGGRILGNAILLAEIFQPCPA